MSKQIIEKYICDLCQKETEIFNVKTPVYRTFDSNDGRMFYSSKKFMQEELDLCYECLEKITKIHSIGVQCEKYELGE